MNEKINFLNLFFQLEKVSRPSFLSENIADYLPVIFIYNMERHFIQYGNRTFTDFTAVDPKGLRSVETEIFDSLRRG